MPHQLRRLVAINIIAAKTGQPSSLIAELDVRGSTLAVGVNGVGKTTLLRTIPLFYGATPKQILRGSHRGSMISYTLPVDSSAIVYEYERTSEDDLRCAVMYRRPGEDEAVFYIMRSGYQERFFVDENEEFVTAQEFKARAEAASVWVSPALHMNEYRSIILREKPMTKNAQKLRELALEHSLGPAALYNLGSIAAAMTTEKINFDDLKRIVVDRVSEDAGNRAGDGVLSQKQSREEVKNWVDTRQHMAALLARAPYAQQLLEKVGDLRKRHMQLCTLHVAVKAALRQMEQKRETLGKELFEFKEQSQQVRLEVANDIKLKSEELAGKRQALDEMVEDLRRIGNQSKHFVNIDIDQLVELQAQESTLQSRQAGLKSEFETLTNTAKDAQQRAQDRSSALQRAASGSKSSISQRRETALFEDNSARERLRKEEVVATGELKAPKRLDEIATALRQLERDKGGVERDLKSPHASTETLAALELGQKDLDHLEADFTTKQEAVEQARKIHTRCEREAVEATVALDQLNNLIQRAHENLQRLQGQLEPQPGTLLAFLRDQDESLWVDSSRVIDPTLLQRNDLDPELLDTRGKVDRVEVGPFSLDISRIDAPDWVSMPGLRHEIALQEKALSEMRARLKEAQASARSRGKAHQDAITAQQAAEAQLAVIKSQRDNARTILGNLREKEAKEKLENRERTQQVLLELQAQMDELSTEAEVLRQGLAQRSRDLVADFERLRTSMQDALNNQLQALKNEEESLDVQLMADLAKVQQDLNDELQGKGIDTDHINRLQEQLASIQDKLDGIARNRSEVRSWEEFKRDVLPHLPGRQRTCGSLKAETESLSTKLGQIHDRLIEHDRSTKVRHDFLEDEINKAEMAVRRLSELRDQHLKVFLDHVPAIEGDLNPALLESQSHEAMQQLRTLEHEVRTARLSLRGDIQRYEGQAADWLHLKEKELPDPQTVLSHQYEWIWAEMVCKWFEPAEHGPLLAQLNREMQSIFMKASGFLNALDSFGNNIDNFNRRLRKALSEFTPFESFGELSVNVRSGVGKIEYLEVLKTIAERHRALSGSLISLVANDRSLPSDEDTNLMRAFRSVLQGEGGFSINLREQVELECSLRENNKPHKVTNQEEFAAISSNGLTALITAMFLMGFVQMIRGSDSPVRLTWITDEIGRFSPENVANFLKTLSDCGVNVISAAPSADPLIAKHFCRLCSFEPDASILTAAAEGATE